MRRPTRHVWSGKDFNFINATLLLEIHSPRQLFFFMLGNKKNSQMVPNQENVEGDQPVQSHSRAHQPL